MMCIERGGEGSEAHTSRPLLNDSFLCVAVCAVVMLWLPLRLCVPQASALYMNHAERRCAGGVRAALHAKPELSVSTRGHA